MKNTDPMGRLLLKTAGILMLVFGIFGVLVYLALLGVLVGVNFVTDGVFSGAKDIVGMSLLLAASAAELTAGIKALKTLKRREKAAGCRIWTVLALVLGLAALLHILLRGGDPGFWLSIPLAVVTPAACLIGLSRRMAEEDETEEEETAEEEPGQA